MDTQTFLDSLQSFGQDKNLIFDLGGCSVAPGYHVTEVKAVTVQAMDCGGRAGAWHETVVQLWSPGAQPDEGYMKVGKFLGIYGRVAASVPIDGGAVLRFEYGDVGEPAIGYLVGGVSEEAGAVKVNLSAPGVACKLQSPEIKDVPLAVAAASPSCCELTSEQSVCCA